MDKRTASIVGAIIVVGGLFAFAGEADPPSRPPGAGSDDCNENGIPDRADIANGTSPDCNMNGIPDECDVVSSSLDIFATGLDLPEDIVPSQGAYPPGFFVPDFNANAVWHVSPDGGVVAQFATGFLPIGAVLAPDEFGGMGDRLFVANRTGGGTPPGVLVVDADGNVTQFAVITVGITGLAYIPLAVGGPSAGKLLATGQGLLYTIDTFGEAELLLPSLGPRMFTPALAPTDFGAFAHNIFGGQSSGDKIVAIDLQTNHASLFGRIPLGPDQAGLRQIAFSPTGWFAPLDPALTNQSVMVVSVSGSTAGGGSDGALVALDGAGVVIATLTQTSLGLDFDPRGLLFVGSDLVVSNVADGTILRLSVGSFPLSDCNANGVPDACDVDDGSSEDCTANGIPDECEPDCNGNGAADSCDLADQTSEDCNLNGIPDECDISSGSSQDNNSDDVPDECDFLVVQDRTDAGAQELGLSVCNVHVQFPGPFPDYKLVSIANTLISTDDPAGFFQHPLGLNTAPPEVLIDFDPTLIYDSFVTIGLKTVPEGVLDATVLDPDFSSPFFNNSGLVLGGWFNAIPNNDQGHPDDNFQVLIAQFTVGMGYTVSGTVVVNWQSPDGGSVVQTPTAFECVSQPCESDADCDDGHPCTDDTCSDIGICVNTSVDCDDGDSCTVDSCDGPSGECVHQPVDCDDGNPCTTDSCDPASGCVNEPNTNPCDDGDACTTDDTCTDGACAGGPPVDCDDGVECTVDGCVEDNCVSTVDDTICDNGLYCDGLETCDATRGCQAGDPPCGDLNCDEDTDTCVCLADDDCDDGVNCTLDECLDSVCVNTPDATFCDNGLFCDGLESCDPVAGCQPGTAPCIGQTCDENNDDCCERNADCDDGDACTIDSCDPDIGCLYIPLECDDNNLCTHDDCDPVAGCVNTPVNCDDNNLCTDDDCDPVAGCVNMPNDLNSCDDGDACNGGELCVGGICHAGTPLDCDDVNLCTDDDCDPLVGCVNSPNDGSSCDDGDVCNGDETCLGGICQAGTPADCDDMNPCTDDGCDPVGGCVNTPNDLNSCDDGDGCNGDETCVGGTCQAGTPLDCDDNDACTENSCDFDAGGCVATPIDCNDEDACTEDSCDSDFGCMNAPFDCDDGNECTEDGCDSDTGCTHEDIECPEVQVCDPETGECVVDQDPCECINGKVTLCHVPPGHPARARTITVRCAARDRHLAHGDVCGPCEDGDG